MNNDILLKIENISKIFKKGNKEFQALKNVNISLKKGETIGIVGESGCGKSTLAKIIMGIEPRTSGELYLEGEKIDRLLFDKAKRQNVQIIFQEPISSFNPRMIIEDYLWEPLRNYKKMSKKEAYPLLEQAMLEVGLHESFLTRYPHQLSGGQLQRVAIARAIIMAPKLVILDEATSALDTTTQNLVLGLLEHLKKCLGLSYIFIGHNLPAVQKISDRIFVMYKGEIVEEVESKNFKNNTKNPYTKYLIESSLD